MIIAGSIQSTDGSRVAWPPGDAVKSSAFHQLKIKHDIRGIGAAIFFDDPARIGESVDKLAEALQTDIG
jgi:hypothetical protein